MFYGVDDARLCLKIFLQVFHLQNSLFHTYRPFFIYPLWYFITRFIIYPHKVYCKDFFKK